MSEHVKPASVSGLALSSANVDALTNCVGGGRIMPSGAGWQLIVGPERGQRYSNSQLDDYHHDHAWRWQPPLHLTVRARFSHGASGLRGTAGFGFWNDPVGMTLHGRLRPPQTAWFFFGAPPNDLKFDLHTPGSGWKAATLDALRPRAIGATALLPVTWLSAQWQATHQRLWPWMQRQWGIAEAALSHDLRQRHTYEIFWRTNGLEFGVDNEIVLTTPFAPRGPLGLVVWIDNQYMVATPQGQFGAGCLATDEQWLEIEQLQIEIGS